MANGMIGNEHSNSTNQLKSIVKESLAVLCGSKDSPRTNSEGTETQTGSPRPRSLPLHVDAVNLRKGALVNAAKALAVLWKVSEPGRPKLQSRAMQYSR